MPHKSYNTLQQSSDYISQQTLDVPNSKAMEMVSCAMMIVFHMSVIRNMGGHIYRMLVLHYECITAV